MNSSSHIGPRIDAELSSLISQLESLTQRIEDLARPDTGSNSDGTEVASGLHEVERHLRSALREISRVRRTTQS
ncbi:MAG: hypothetical protein P8M16_02250 [Acidimicrobiales bacterium]|nr:hypothetical protein [Acidimicrobiales bacterium]